MLGLIAAAGKSALSSFGKGGKYLKNQTAQGLSNVKKKTVSAKTFLKKDGGDSNDGDYRGGPIVLRPSTSLTTKTIKPTSFFDKELGKETKKDAEVENKKDFEEILNELSLIKSSLTKINESINSNLTTKKEQLKKERINRSKRSARERESELEKKRKSEEKGGLAIGKPKMGFFDMILNYLTNVFLGSLAVFALSKLPQIIDAFNQIGKNLSNTFNQIRFAISSLATNFPKQIKALANLFKKIVTSRPAQAIGKLLASAGKAVANIFGKAAKAIFNLVKNPIKNLLGKSAAGAIGGAAKGIGSITKRGFKRAVPRAAAKIGGKNAAAGAAKLGLLTGKGLKHFSRIGSLFKRIPFIGALIGIGIDLALGTPPDAAVAGAIGSSLGAAIGGAIGTGLIPIPILGTAAGGFIGAAVGDWAGKEIYKNLKGNITAILPQGNDQPVQKKAEGGEVFSATRETGVEKRTIKKVIVDKPIRRPAKSQPVSKQTEDVAKESLFKGDKSFGRFKRLSKTYSDMRFVGTLLKLGIDIGMGEKPSQTNMNVAADSLAYSIATAIKNETLELPGVNKNTSGTIANTLSSWARKEVYKEIMMKRGELALRESEKDEGISGDLDDLGDGMGVYVSSDSPDFWLLATAAMFENSDPQGAADVAQVIYNRVAMPGDPWNVNNSISKAILNPGQFQPVSDYGGVSAWSQIKDKNSALRHAKSYGKSQAQLETVAAAILDKSKQQNARNFVGPRDSFRATSFEDKNNHLADDTEVRRLGHVFGFEPRGATIGSFKAGKLSAAQVSDTIKGDVTEMSNFEGPLGPISTVSGIKDQQGRAVQFAAPAASAFQRMMKDASRQGVIFNPYDIASTYRTPQYNKQIGGATNSLHTKGLAGDIHGVTGSWIRKYGSRYGWYPNDYPGTHGGHYEFRGSRFIGGFIDKDGKYFLHKGEVVVDKDTTDILGKDNLLALNSIENKSQLKSKANELIEKLKEYTDSTDSETTILFPLLPKEQPQAVAAEGSSMPMFMPSGSVNNRITYDTVLQSALYKNG